MIKHINEIKKGISILILEDLGNPCLLKFCIEKIKENSFYNHEILFLSQTPKAKIKDIVNKSGIPSIFFRKDFNKSFCDILEFATKSFVMPIYSDMVFLKNWDTHIVSALEKEYLEYDKIIITPTIIGPNTLTFPFRVSLDYGDYKTFNEEQLVSDTNILINRIKEEKEIRRKTMTSTLPFIVKTKEANLLSNLIEEGEPFPEILEAYKQINEDKYAYIISESSLIYRFN